MFFTIVGAQWHHRCPAWSGVPIDDPEDPLSPFVLFRMWARRAPVSDRVAVGTVFALLSALLVWIAVPEPTHSTNAATGSGPLNLSAGSGSTPPSGSPTGVH